MVSGEKLWEEKETEPVEFREVGATGVFIARTKTNQEKAMNLLQQNGFRH
jgi:hypothetical protein